MKKNALSLQSPQTAELIRTGGIGIIPTDTLYGICADANQTQAVEEIYRLKGRDRNKPLIILISNTSQLSGFISLSPFERKTATKYWPGPCSIVFPCHKDQLAYLHRGTQSLAFRLPNDPELTKLIDITGPIVAPSANPQGKPPAQTIFQAQQYFPQGVDFFINGGRKNSPPSKLLKIENGKIIQLR